ncbi:MAG TPA: polysaccharide deacetylase family protein [Gemmatimonadaceae bacterium]|nr:polysaccharide deacetylase family protein [Gemmatimonadaceae bacterium]
MTDRVCFTVDLEPDCPPFLSGFRGVEHGLPALLDLLAELDVKATFFTTGEVAMRYPAAIERLVGEGHELACHGMTHTAFTELSPEAARDEIERSAEILRTFDTVTSFRAPYLKFPAAYVAYLHDNGFALDSSQAKYKLEYYRTPRLAGIARVPASVTSSVLRLPRVIRSLYLSALSSPIVLFVHPWEFVDLTREKIRWDCRFRTGDTALACVRDVLAAYHARGARFARMRELAA